MTGAHKMNLNLFRLKLEAGLLCLLLIRLLIRPDFFLLSVFARLVFLEGDLLCKLGVNSSKQSKVQYQSYRHGVYTQPILP